MPIITDWILVIGTLATCFYCWTVSKSLRKVQGRTTEMLQALEGLEGRAEAVRDAGRRVIADLKWAENSLMDERARAAKTLEVVGEQIEQIRSIEGRSGAIVQRLLEAAQAAREAKLELNECMRDFESARSTATRDIAEIEAAAARLKDLEALKMLEGAVVEAKAAPSRPRRSPSRKSAPAKSVKNRNAPAGKAAPQSRDVVEAEPIEAVG